MKRTTQRQIEANRRDCAKWARANREKVTARVRRWQIANRERYKAQQRATRARAKERKANASQITLPF